MNSEPCILAHRTPTTYNSVAHSTRSDSRRQHDNRLSLAENSALNRLQITQRHSSHDYNRLRIKSHQHERRFFPTNTGHKNRQLGGSVMWNVHQQNDDTRRGGPLCVRGEVFQRTDAVLPREIALEVGLENLETVAIHDVSTVSGNVEAWRVRLVNDESVGHNDKIEPAFSDNTSLGTCTANLDINSYIIDRSTCHSVYEHFSSTSLKNLFEHVDNRNILDLIKETYFYNQL